MLVNVGGMREKEAFGFVLLCEGDCAGNGIADIDSLYKLKVHFCGEKADHAADMRDHACREQAGDNATSKPATLNKRFVDVIWVVVAGDATEEDDITIREGAPEGEGLSHLYSVEGFFQLLLEFGCCI